MSYKHFSVINRIMSHIKNATFDQGTRLPRNYRGNCQACRLSQNRFKHISKCQVSVNGETTHGPANKLLLPNNKSSLTMSHWCTKQNVISKLIGKRPISTVTGIYLFGKPIIVGLLLIGSRVLRKMFKDLNPAERKKIIVNFLRENVHILFVFLCALFLTARDYYYSHLEETPITKRKRFVSVSRQSSNEIAQEQAHNLLRILQRKLVTSDDPRVTRVLNVADRIIDNNPRVKTLKVKWNFFLADEPVMNTCAFSNGYVFISNDILEMCDTDDQLAVILGHEMAHVVLNHGIEGLSFESHRDWFMIIAFVIISSMVNFFIAAFLTLFLTAVLKTLLFNPVERKQEWEADYLGLLFAAKACYDISEAGVLWKKIAPYQSMRETLVPIWIGSMGKHPDVFRRAEYINSLMEDADGWRKANGCPQLPKTDPKDK